MSKLLIIIGFMVMVGIFYWLYEILKARYVVRKFFEAALEAQTLYSLYIFLLDQEKTGEEIVKLPFELKFTEGDIKYTLNLTEETILYYDEYYLRDFKEPSLENTYDNLNKIAIELRRWLWVTTNKK